MIYLYLFGTCFHFIDVFMIIGNICIVITQLTKGRKKKFWVFVARISLKTLSFGN